MVWPPDSLTVARLDGATIFAAYDNEQSQIINDLVAHLVAAEAAIAAVQASIVLADWNAPRGVLGVSQRVTAQAGITAVVDQGVSVAITAVANRRLLVIASANAVGTVNGDLLLGYITDGSNVILRRYYQSVDPAGASGQQQTGFLWHTPAAGPMTYKLRAERSGTGSMTVSGDAAGTYGPSLIVLDAGSNGPPP